MLYFAIFLGVLWPAWRLDKLTASHLRTNAGRFHMIKFILSNLKLLENGLTRNQQFYLPFEHIPKLKPCLVCFGAMTYTPVGLETCYLSHHSTPGKIWFSWTARGGCFESSLLQEMPSGQDSGRPMVKKRWATKRPSYFHHTGCLIGILTMAYYNPHITG